MNKPQRNRSNPPHQVQFTQATFYQGQMPPPEMLEHCERIQPGFTNRLLTMVEAESAHRQREETAIRKAFSKNSFYGLICAFLAVAIVSAVSWYALYRGAFTAASAIMGSSAAAVILAFMAGRRKLKGPGK